MSTSWMQTVYGNLSASHILQMSLYQCIKCIKIINAERLLNYYFYQQVNQINFDVYFMHGRQYVANDEHYVLINK